MSLTIDKLSLLASLTPPRQKTDINTVPQGSAFADKLDKALDGGVTSASSATGKAKELAHSLTMQMLESSLSLAGDYSPNTGVPLDAQQHPSVHTLLEAYRANLAADREQSSLISTQSPLKDDTGGLSESASAVKSSKAQGDFSVWLDSVIAEASQKYGVDPGLIKAVIKAESNFNPQAESRAGARGLMQLMPATARSLGVSDSFDPEQNVMAGTRFLKDMLQRYNGDVDAALAAYNWGPGNVDKRPEHLPRETRDYLARVKQLYAAYSG
ncbi:MAG TPA: lytic transglycosylase domain-containing protein [Desulfuromonadales bacterium]|nr:lytic transglycosylase domain-containing protein [Desulfuromonadales bacterium]